MTERFSKLTVICNGCFWASVGLRFVPHASAWPTIVVSTIAVLGAVALVVNVVWLVGLALRWWLAPGRPLGIFNGLSFLSQLVLFLFSNTSS
jgi:hypothetical protein